MIAALTVFRLIIQIPVLFWQCEVYRSKHPSPPNRPKPCDKMCNGVTKTKVELFGHYCKWCSEQKQSPKEYHIPEAWWRQHRAMGLLFVIWHWGSSQGSMDNSKHQSISLFWCRTCRLKTKKKKKNSHSSMISTQSTNPSQRRNGFRTKKIVHFEMASQSSDQKPVEWLEKGAAQEILLQFERFAAFLQEQRKTNLPNQDVLSW